MYFRPLSIKIHAPPVSWASCLTFTKKQKGPVKQWSVLGVGFSADLRESAGTVAKTPPRGFSHPLCLLNSVPFDPCSTGHSSASFQKTTPQKGIFTSWTQMIPEPNNMAGCPLCPPQHCRGKCREGLVVSCVDLVPVSCSPKFSVLGKHKAQGEQSECFNLVLALGWFWPICLLCGLGRVFL